MERIFTYIAAFLSRLVFWLHASFLVWWVTQVKQDTTYWLFLGIMAMLLIETAVTVFHRRGNEYYWYVHFCTACLIDTIFKKFEIVHSLINSSDWKFNLFIRKSDLFASVFTDQTFSIENQSYARLKEKSILNQSIKIQPITPGARMKSLGTSLPITREK